MSFPVERPPFFFCSSCRLETDWENLAETRDGLSCPGCGHFVFYFDDND
jgi:hypothetical protein